MCFHMLIETEIMIINLERLHVARIKFQRRLVNIIMLDDAVTEFSSAPQKLNLFLDYMSKCILSCCKVFLIVMPLTKILIGDANFFG